MITQLNFWVNYPPELNCHSYNYIAEEEGLSEKMKDKITLYNSKTTWISICIGTQCISAKSIARHLGRNL